jgi:hypothetical protein
MVLGASSFSGEGKRFSNALFILQLGIDGAVGLTILETKVFFYNIIESISSQSVSSLGDGKNLFLLL